MNKSVVSILGLSAIVCIGAGALMAEAAPTNEASAAAAKAILPDTSVDNNFDSRIDTWVEGVVIKLDALGSKFTVAGHKMPYASAHAGMLSDSASKSVGLDSNLRAAKDAEVRLAWQETLTKASNEDRPKDGEIQCHVPAKGQLIVRTEASLPNLDFVHHEKSMATVPAGASDQSVAAPVVPARNDQEIAKSEPTKSSNDKQTEALGAFGQLKIGEPVYVGSASGILSNEAHAVIKRVNLEPTQPGKE